MNTFACVTKPLMGTMALLLIALAAGCGGEGNDPVLGGVGIGHSGVPGAPPGSIPPGSPAGTCTGASGPTIPTITSSNPANGSTTATASTAGVANNGKSVTATFSLAMNPATINSSPAGTLLTFTLKNSATQVNVAGTVAMNVGNTIATFNTSAALSPSTQYTAIITQAAKSATGTSIDCVYAWAFTTEPTPPALAVNLGLASTFGIASRAGMTSTGVTVVNGDVALSPTAACTDSTGNNGASQTCLTKIHTSPTGLTVNGSIYFAGDPFDNGGTANTVTNDLNTAWVEGRNKVDTFATGFLVGQLGATGPAGKVLAPGVYHEAALGLAAGTVVTFDAANNSSAIFIIKVDSSFVDSGTLLLPTQVKLANGAQARNIWLFSGLDITIGSGTIWNGNILAGRDATIKDGSAVQGRVLAGASGAGAITLTGAASPSLTSVTVP